MRYLALKKRKMKNDKKNERGGKKRYSHSKVVDSKFSESKSASVASCESSFTFKYQPQLSRHPASRRDLGRFRDRFLRVGDGRALFSDIFRTVTTGREETPHT